MAFDRAREARIARKEMQATAMDQKFYELEVERTKNLGNMTTALLMLASSMDTLTRYCYPINYSSYFLVFLLLFFSVGEQCGWCFEPLQGSPTDLPLPFAPLSRLYLH